MDGLGFAVGIKAYCPPRNRELSKPSWRPFSWHSLDRPVLASGRLQTATAQSGWTANVHREPRHSTATATSASDRPGLAVRSTTQPQILRKTWGLGREHFATEIRNAASAIRRYLRRHGLASAADLES